MFSHIITFESSLPEARGGHSLCAIICERVLIPAQRCQRPNRPRQNKLRAKKKPDPKIWLLKMFPAITYFRTSMHYHWPRKLNGRVRNGNVCFLVGIVTGMHRSASKAAFFCVKKSKCIATSEISRHIVIACTS